MDISVPPLLTRQQVARMLNLHPETIKRMERRGQLSPVRLNSRVVRYKLSEVQRLIHAASKSEFPQETLDAINELTERARRKI